MTFSRRDHLRARVAAGAPRGPRVRRWLAPAVAAAIVAVVLGAGASPAFAHAALISVEPQPESVLDTAPKHLDLLFSDPIELSLAKIAVYDGSGEQVRTGRPHHVGGQRESVRASLPKLDDGSYIVTWRVVSIDSHPVQASFTFQVGPRATVSDPRGLAERLLANQKGGVVVGTAYATARWVLFSGLALLIGGALFLVAIVPGARAARASRRLVWGGWWASVVATVLGIGLEGAYGAARSVFATFDPGLFGDVLGTRYGTLALARLGLLAVAWPLLRVLLRADRSEHAPSRVWCAAAAVVAIGLALTPGLGGHATSGRVTGVAVPADALHVLSMAAWLGGLVLLAAVVLREPEAPDLDEGLRRFSNLALACVALLVATGAFQTWRQVGSIEALRDTDYGRVLLVKLGVVAALVVAAAFSREIVGRRLSREAVEDDATEGDATEGDATEGDATDAPNRREVVRVGALPDGPGAMRLRTEVDVPRGDVGRLRRTVAIEVVLAAAVLVASSILVNQPPARATSQTGPITFTMTARAIEVDVIVSPGVRGSNDVHVTVLNRNGTLANVTDMQVQLANPERDIAPITVALRRLGPGHYLIPGFDIPFGGEWQLVAKVSTGPTDLVTLAQTFTVR